VTSWILQQLVLQPWVQERYLLSDIDGRTFVNGQQSYGVIMLIDKNLDLKELFSVQFPTGQGRLLLFAQIQCRTEIILIGTVHLESKQNQQLRSQQLQICQPIFNRYATEQSNATCLLMGDFNFDSTNVVQMNILSEWIDLWLALHDSHNLGWTRRNLRYDRIMFRSVRIIPSQIQIIGNEPIDQFPTGNLASNIASSDLTSNPQRAQQMVDVFPSDHFGLLADFDLSHV